MERRASHRVVVKKFQLRFLFGNLLYLYLIGTVFLWTLFLPSAWPLLDPSTTSADLDQAALVFLALHAHVWIGVAVASVLALLRMAVASHRVAGPLVRLTSLSRSIRRGDVSMRFRVRAKDYLTQEAAAVDSMVTGLRRRFRALKGRTRKLDRAVVDLRAALDDTTGHPYEQRIRAVEEQVRRLRAHLDDIQTAAPQAVADSRAPCSTSTTERARPAQARRSGPDGRQAGFTLIEILLVAAIVTTVSAISVPMYEQAKNRARVVRAIADIRAIAVEIQAFGLTNSGLPNTLAEVNLDMLRDPYGMPYQYLRIAGGRPGKGGVRKDHKLNPINADFDLFSMGRNRVFQIQLTNKDSLDDIVRANNGGFIGLASEY